MIRLLFTGDLCPHHRVEEYAGNGRTGELFTDVRDLLDGNDLNITDLECPLTLFDNSRPKTGPHQKANPQTIEVLLHARIGLAAMANNHILDYGSAGLEQTMALCHEMGIKTVGVGQSKGIAAEPVTMEIKGNKLAFLNVADHEFLSAPDGPFVANALDPVNHFREISLAKKTNDLVIMILHAGNEFYHLPSPRLKSLCRFFVECGADAVITHHTHRYSGYEVYNDRPIFYGLGNFLYDWPGKTNTHWNEGYLVRLKIDQAIGFDIIPIKQCNEKPGVFSLSEEENEKFIIGIRSLNEIIEDDQMLKNKFDQYCRSVYPMYDAFIEPWFGRWINALQKREILPKLLTRRKRLLLLNLIRCESHRDVLLQMLKKYE